jgi:acetyl-CoA carboxylase biotin carboxyl carrier protein
MTEEAPVSNSSDAELFRSVCDAANGLLTKVGGPVRRIAVQAGPHRVEIEWEPVPVVVSASSGSIPAEAALTAGTDAAAGRYAVTAPLVGTFYGAPEPGAKAFVEVGDAVEAGQDVAIVEAMKIMNRVTTEQGGKVVEITVSNGDMVEFGQVLMYLAPLDEG